MRPSARLILPLLALASGAAHKPFPIPTPTLVPKPVPTKVPKLLLPKLEVRYATNGGPEVATLASPVLMKKADSVYVKAWVPAEKVPGNAVSLTAKLTSTYYCSWREGSSIYSGGPFAGGQSVAGTTVASATQPYKIILAKLTVSAASTAGCPVQKPGDPPSKHTFSSATATLTIRATAASGLATTREVTFQIT